MEQLELTEPVVDPETTTSHFKVIALTMNIEATVTVPTPELNVQPLMKIDLRDNLGKLWSHSYMGQVALDFIKYINTANFTTKSLHKRILERLSNDGILPGTVTGTPDPPAGAGI